MNTKVNGFPVIVHQGREITAAQAFQIDPHWQSNTAFIQRMNGPHHTAKWAVNLAEHNRNEYHKRICFGMRTISRR